jgi:hypothetical protein
MRSLCMANGLLVKTTKSGQPSKDRLPHDGTVACLTIV